MSDFNPHGFTSPGLLTLTFIAAIVAWEAAKFIWMLILRVVGWLVDWLQNVK